jgi:8-oxo-dGTP pyrophosphatase MutT (NUDIX family)
VDFDTALTRLDAGFRAPLPGVSAHAWMAPRPRREWPTGLNPGRIRDAAGLLLVFPRDNRAHIVLTVRAETLDRHGGQVSLPGGVVDPGESFEQAALREAHEEIGLSVDLVRVVGALTPIDIPVSGFRLHPVVAVANAAPALRPSDGEVARILDVDVDTLMDPRAARRRTIAREAETFEFPAILVDGAEIWGATAMVLAEFLALMGWGGPAPA